MPASGRLARAARRAPARRHGLVARRDGVRPCGGAGRRGRRRRADRLDGAEPAPRPARAHRHARAGAPARAQPLDRPLLCAVVSQGRARQRSRRQPRLARRARTRRGVSRTSTTGSSWIRPSCATCSPSISARSVTPDRPRPPRCWPSRRGWSARSRPPSSRSSAKTTHSSSPTWGRAACSATRRRPRPQPASGSSAPHAEALAELLDTLTRTTTEETRP